MSVKITTKFYHNNSCNYYTSTHGCPGHLLQGEGEGEYQTMVRTTQLDILSAQSGDN